MDGHEQLSFQSSYYSYEAYGIYLIMLSVFNDATPIQTYKILARDSYL